MKVVEARTMWHQGIGDEVPAFVRRVPLTPYVQSLRASNGQLPELEVVADSIEYSADRERVTFTLLDVANLGEGLAVNMTGIRMNVPRQRVRRTIKHARDLARAPFN